jgi:hypothetical protein
MKLFLIFIIPWKEVVLYGVIGKVICILMDGLTGKTDLDLLFYEKDKKTFGENIQGNRCCKI